ncbi:MAG TPA: hypothetical protein VIA18_22270 [Polyangia bacterium]|nr:hypothetical protein [Polyangia bacterium]
MSVRRHSFGAALLLAVAACSCHGVMRDNKALTPTAICDNCCQQAYDACKMDGGGSPAAVCPPKLQECTTACESGDENEMCVVQTNRELAANAPKQAAAPPAVAKVTAPATRTECDNKGTWSLKIADAQGQSKGCAALDSIPKQVSFRIGRNHEGYVLFDLAQVQNWTDEFNVASGEQQCEVVLSRNNKVDDAHPRALTVKLTERDHEVSGTLKYAEANQPNGGCSLDAAVSGTVAAPLPAPSVPQSSPAPPAPPPQLGNSGGVHGGR